MSDDNRSPGDRRFDLGVVEPLASDILVPDSSERGDLRRYREARILEAAVTLKDAVYQTCLRIELGQYVAKVNDLPCRAIQARRLGVDDHCDRKGFGITAVERTVAVTGLEASQHLVVARCFELLGEVLQVWSGGADGHVGCALGQCCRLPAILPLEGKGA